MNRDEALRLLRGGKEKVEEWNRRREAGEVIPDLAESDLSGANLTGAEPFAADRFVAESFDANLKRVNLTGADLTGADLAGADLFGARLTGARLTGARLAWADLTWADLTWADLTRVNLTEARLFETDLAGARLAEVNLTGAHLTRVNLTGASCHTANFADVDLSQVEGLDSIEHRGPSPISTSTLIRSRGRIPEAFLRGCGLPDAWIDYLPSLIRGMEPIQFYSCFISYSTKDEDFARRLHARMVQEGLRVWYSPEDIQGGKKLHEQIDQAIRVYDKLLLVLSPHSMGSEWVRTEIRKALKIERGEGVRKLFPIRLMDFEAIREWECFDADMGKDLGVELREYFIPDFTAWKDHEAFETSFARLLKDLKAEDSAPNGTAKRTS
jgi:hypothetical protein